jgi:hypothetical protein
MYSAVSPRGVTKTDRKIAAMVLGTKIVVFFISRHVTAGIYYTVGAHYTALLSAAVPSHILHKPTDNNMYKSSNHSFQIT